MLYDAHLHLHDPRLGGLKKGRVIGELGRFGVRKLVVNSTSPEDWDAVAALATAVPELVLPSYGIHPWKVAAAVGPWREDLLKRLDTARGPVGIGEVGLDKWIEEPDFERQVEVFRVQLKIAAERNLPLTIHCLRAWGPLLEILRAGPVPSRGFLIHSVGASPETIRELAALGGYFSVSGAFADPAKKKYHAALRAIPADRLLLETDAPDMLPPEDYRVARAQDPASGEDVSHPLNILGVYIFVREALKTTDEILVSRVHDNFTRFFLDR